MQKHKKQHLKSHYDKAAYLMILPSYLIFTLFILIPILAVFVYSLTNYDTYRMPDFIGLKNYIQIFHDENFLISVNNTLWYTVITLTLQLFIGLLLAVLLYRTSRWVPIFRTAIFMPHVLSMVCVSMVWLWIYAPNFGMMNNLMEIFHFPKQLWLLDPKQALGCVILVSVWKSCGYSMVIFLSGLTGIPDSLYEAAALDGANVIQKFIKITWPMLKPTTFFLVVTGLVNCFAVFEQVNVMTGGGPLNSTTTVAHQIYKRAFLDFKMGYASAISVLLLLFSLTITVLIFGFKNRSQDVDVI